MTPPLRGDTRGSGVRLVYVTRRLPHYRIPVIRALRDAGCDVLVVEAGSLDESHACVDPAQSGLTVVRLSSRRPRWRGDVVRAARAHEPDCIVIEQGARLDFAWTLLLGISKRVPKILWGHGVERHERHSGQRTVGSLARWFQLWLADGVVCYDREIAARMGERFPRKVIGTAPNSNDTLPLLSARRALAAVGQHAVRQRHGLVRTHYLLALGRFIPEKAFDRLIPVLRHVRDAGVDAGVIFIGRGPERGRLEREAKAAGFVVGEDVVFAGWVDDPSTLAEWLYCADVCVNPGSLGLAVVDCLASGVPVVTSRPGPTGPFHGPEWRYLVPDKTGWLVDGTSAGSLAAAVIRYLGLADDVRHQVEAACLEYTEKNLGLEQMVRGLLEVVHATLARS